MSLKLFWDIFNWKHSQYIKALSITSVLLTYASNTEYVSNQVFHIAISPLSDFYHNSNETETVIETYLNTLMKWCLSPGNEPIKQYLQATWNLLRAFICCTNFTYHIVC